MVVIMSRASKRSSVFSALSSRLMLIWRSLTRISTLHRNVAHPNIIAAIEEWAEALNGCKETFSNMTWGAVLCYNCIFLYSSYCWILTQKIFSYSIRSPPPFCTTMKLLQGTTNHMNNSGTSRMNVIVGTKFLAHFWDKIGVVCTGSVRNTCNVSLVNSPALPSTVPWP